MKTKVSMYGHKYSIQRHQLKERKGCESNDGKDKSKSKNYSTYKT